MAEAEEDGPLTQVAVVGGDFNTWAGNESALRFMRDAFPEFGPLEKDCRYADCSHDHEPGCAVFAAVERGELAPTRYASYVEMMDELVPPPLEDEPVPPPDRDP